MKIKKFLTFIIGCILALSLISCSSKDNTAFLNLVMPIQNAVGTYEKNSLEFIDAEVQKGTINVLYKAKFTNEDEPVRISISFKEDDPDHKVCGLLFNSPKIEELSKENK